MPRNMVDDTCKSGVRHVRKSDGSMVLPTRKPNDKSSNVQLNENWSDGARGRSSSTNHNSFSNQKTHAENDKHRRPSRDGEHLGSTSVSKGRSSSHIASLSEKRNVDTDFNRKIGHAVEPMRSMPVSKKRSSSQAATSRWSEKRYADNDSNGKIDRAGEHMESMPVSKGRSSNHTASSSEKKHTYNYNNRRLGHVSEPVGRMSVFKGSCHSYTDSPSEKRYADNGCNRKIVRAGEPLRSMPVSQGRSSSHSASSSEKKSSGNDKNRKIGHVSEPVGSVPTSKESLTGCSASSRQKAYAENDYNRRPIRSGESTDNMQVSKRSTSSQRMLGHTGEPTDNISVSKEISSSQRASSNLKTYADNDKNKRTVRSDESVGSMHVSKGSSSRGSGISNENAYVENDFSRNAGRVSESSGTEHVSNSRSDSNTSSSQNITSNNASDRSIDLFPEPVRKLPICKGRFSDSYTDKFSDQNASAFSGELETGTSLKLYKDNAMNRRIGRAGKPVGTCVVQKIGGKTNICAKYYVDNALNRRLKRVGKPRGSMPNPRVSKQTDDTLNIINQILSHPDVDFESNNSSFYEESIDRVAGLFNREIEEMAWKENNRMSKIQTLESVLTNLSGKEIALEDIELGRKIGQGGFGDVHFAKWNGSVVAVKKLRVQKVSKRRLKDFSTDVMAFCNLENPHIVKFIGACLTIPNLCIVMEYMQTSLFEALHISQDIDLSENERLDVIKQTCGGLVYLHTKGIAHCDLKSSNILLDYEAGKSCIAKITDFGLSMIKPDADASLNTAKQVCYVCTPRYSAPEVLRGEELSENALVKADVYSLALIVYEIIYEAEPFYNLSGAQLQKQREKGIIPDIPEDIAVTPDVEFIMKQCWDFKPNNRPRMEEVLCFFKTQSILYTK